MTALLKCVTIFPIMKLFDSTSAGQTRRSFLAFSSTLALYSSKFLQAHDLKPGDPDYHFKEYEAIVNDPNLVIRHLYEYSNINNAIIFSNAVNGLNGFQFSYGIPANRIRVVIQAYASANAVTYDDYIWEKYKFGEARNIKDPITGEFATRNIYYPATVPYTEIPNSIQPSDRNHPFYSDSSIEGLQRRLVLFST